MASDHFSTQSADYARYRPDYPAGLFAWIASLVSERRVAWDCACGSGQATAGLAPWFDHIEATDLSAQQLSHAPSLDKVSWRVATAEESGLSPESVDLSRPDSRAGWGRPSPRATPTSWPRAAWDSFTSPLRRNAPNCFPG